MQTPNRRDEGKLDPTFGTAHEVGDEIAGIIQTLRGDVESELAVVLLKRALAKQRRIELLASQRYTALMEKQDELLGMLDQLQEREEEAIALGKAEAERSRELEAALTELRAAQEAKVRAQRLATIGQLAASIGHDLRNPLSAIRNSYYYINRRLASSELAADDRITKMLGVMGKELDACSQIIGDLLDFARERRPNLVPCALDELIDDAISVVQPPRPMEIRNEAATLTLQLDADQFRQVLVNLVQNATEAVPEDKPGLVRVTTAASDTGVRIAVIDNGSGIPDDIREHIFEPLYTTKKKGTGLGLAIIANIVGRHGGTIDVTSSDAGSEFFIHLPLDAGEETDEQ